MSKSKYWRFVAVFCGLFISSFFGLSTLTLTGLERTVYLYALIPLGIFMIYSMIHQMRFPLDLRLYIVWTFIFSYMAVAYGTTALSMMIFCCACYLGKEFRLFTSRKVLKLTVAILLFFVSAAFQFRLPYRQLINSLMEFIVSMNCLIFMYYIMNHMAKKISRDIFLESRKENLEDYFSQDSFTERDKEMLREVLSGCKYEEIAYNHTLSLSSVKKRLAFLYKKVGVTNQIDFIIKFSGKDPESK